VKPSEPDGTITHEQDRILTAFANQAALALERVTLTKRAGN
jgi:K+-sensing histidine kinase KdpD